MTRTQAEQIHAQLRDRGVEGDVVHDGDVYAVVYSDPTDRYIAHIAVGDGDIPERVMQRKVGRIAWPEAYHVHTSYRLTKQLVDASLAAARQHGVDARAWEYTDTPGEYVVTIGRTAYTWEALSTIGEWATIVKRGIG